MSLQVGGIGQCPVQERREIAIHGIVLSVGFRPFVYALAQRHGLAGVVCKTPAAFTWKRRALPKRWIAFWRVSRQNPPLAVIETVTCQRRAALGDRGFRIEASR